MLGTQRFLIIIAAGLIGLSMAGAVRVAQADPPWRHDGWHHEHDDDDWGPRWVAPPPVYYAPPPPPVYYAPTPPPPVYYAPPPPPAYYVPPVLSFGLNIPFGDDDHR